MRDINGVSGKKVLIKENIQNKYNVYVYADLKNNR